MVLHAIHACSGYGGFELTLRLAGIPARTVAHVERDSYAAATLVARMEDQALDQAPVWSDLATFDGRPWRGRVDLITAGLPCQPFSSAGAGLGLEDERHLWPHLLRIIGEVGPSFVMLENVPDVVRLGWLNRVAGDLADAGFDAEWSDLSASDVGAPHRRRRFWLLAHANVDGQQSVGREPGDDRDARCDIDGRSGATVGDPESGGRSEQVRDDDARQPDAPGSVAPVADTEGSRDPLGGGGSERTEPTRTGPPDDRRWPPLRGDHDGWADYIADGGPEPSVRRGVDGRPEGLADALHLGGNGLIPLVAAEAFAELATRAGIGRKVRR